MYKSRRISISWLKRRSGNYALKGITITEGERAYDSSSAFREEDAIWLTSILGASPDVEVSPNFSTAITVDSGPEWARIVANQQNPTRVPPMELERAGTTLLRCFLEQMVAASKSGAAETSDLRALAERAAVVLQETDAGTHYTLADALSLINSQKPKVAPTKAKK